MQACNHLSTLIGLNSYGPLVTQNSFYLYLQSAVPGLDYPQYKKKGSALQGTRETLQVQNISCLLVLPSVSCMANQDTQVKCFVAASTCRDDSEPCKQTRSCCPLLVEGAKHCSCCLTDKQCKATREGHCLCWSWESWFNTLQQRRVFIYHWLWHVYKVLRDSFQSLRRKLYT